MSFNNPVSYFLFLNSVCLVSKIIYKLFFSHYDFSPSFVCVRVCVCIRKSHNFDIIVQKEAEIFKSNSACVYAGQIL